MKSQKKIRNALDNDEKACGIFIDLQKAFDTVNHGILVDKLAYYGIRGVANNWFKSYLTNRKQYVSINGYKSDTMVIKHGVPQGSVLGPLLFLVYINDLHKAIHYSKTYHFADDTHLLNINMSAKRIQKQMNIDLKCLFQWLLANKISLNCSKTELIFFHPKRREQSYQLKIKINGHRLIPTNNIKYLGVYLDDDLSGKQHCKILAGKLNRANGMLSKVRHYVSGKELKSIFHAIFSSHLTYGCEIWAQAENSFAQRIGKIQNKALRILNFKEFNSPSLPLYIENKVFKLDDIVRLRNCLFIYDFINGSLPNCFQDYFLSLSDVYSTYETRSSKLGALFVPAVNTTTYGINSIIYKSIQCWNYITNTYKIDLTKLTRVKVKKVLLKILNDEMLSSMNEKHSSNN